MSRIFLNLILALIALAGGFHAMAQGPLEEPGWDLALARHAASRIETQPTLAALFRLAREDKNDELLRELERVGLDSDWPAPAREKVLHEFAMGLADLPAWSVSPAALSYLERYQPQTRIPHEEHPGACVPLYNIRAAAAGSANEWRRQSAAARAKQLIELDRQAWIEAYLASSPTQRKGFEDALVSADREQLEELGALSLQRISKNPPLTVVAGKSGLLLSDPFMFRRAISAGGGPGMVNLLRAASRDFSGEENYSLLEYSIYKAPPANASLAIAVLAPHILGQPGTPDLMFRTLGHPRLGTSAALVLAASDDPVIQSRLALTAAEENSLASKRAALAISNRQAITWGGDR
jgi:hypothetical protein